MKKKTPAEFLDEIRQTLMEYQGDIEALESEVDFSMEQLLISLGYEDAILLIRSQLR